MGNKLAMFSRGFTVGDLLEFIKEHDIPLDAPIVYQRIEDIYFENNGWRGVMKEGESYHRAKRHNDDVDSEKYKDQVTYPNMTPEEYEKFAVKISDEILEQLKDEYVHVHSPVMFDKEHLYLTAHY